MATSRGLALAYRILETARRAIVIAMFSFVVLSGAVQIFLRYVPGLRPMDWTDEIMRYLNIWLIFLGAGLTARANGHMVMDFFISKLFPARLLPAVRRVTLGIVCIALGFLAVVSYGTVLSSMDFMIQSFQFPIAYFYLAIPVGCVLMFVEYLLIIVFGYHPFDSQRGEEAS